MGKSYQNGPFLQANTVLTQTATKGRNKRPALGLRICPTADCGNELPVFVDASGWPQTSCPIEGGCGHSNFNRGEQSSRDMLDNITQWATPAAASKAKAFELLETINTPEPTPPPTPAKFAQVEAPPELTPAETPIVEEIHNADIPRQQSKPTAPESEKPKPKKKRTRRVGGF